MKKKKLVALLAATAMFSAAGGAYATTNVTTIKAVLNGDLKFSKDGGNWRPTDENGNQALPITYKGTTYLPLRVLANSFQLPVKYDPKSKTIQIGSSVPGLTFYSSQVKTDHDGAEFIDVIDKNQLVFGGQTYKGAFAFRSSYSPSFNVKMDFGSMYNKLHLMLVGKDDLTVRVYNSKKQQLTEDIKLVKDQVTEVDIDLQGSDGIMVYGFGGNVNQIIGPFIYILKDSYVSNGK
ncbi:stalk domain-containing protein [Paenibacillus sp. CF384]|uniref:stalk domain-containing protein n=1 Tax=Paenibacillus sp. CF384 TaxID=1884382 RepID=UPI00089CAFCD|nr:stalk domain-containing protein [Paenibacillus sp. CF384]SDX39676.1 Copper amine oxidase N-terminal domain-containing protein [Paenibacillus sp. CF384]